MFRKLILTASLAAAALGTTDTARAGWPPKLPSIPTPNIPKPDIPDPVDAARKAAERAREERDRVAREAERIAREAREARDRALQEAARVDQLRRQAQEIIGQFNRYKQDAERLKSEYEKYERLAKGDDARLRAEAYRQLRAAGVMGSNQAEVKKAVERGFGHTLWGKEVDHIEEQKFATALAASAAGGNPGPALAYVKQYAADTKKTLLAQLKAAPKEVQRKAEAEFERLLVDALDQAVRNGRAPELRFGGVTLTVGVATYHHWCAVKYREPQLVGTQKVLGVQLYEVRFKPQEKRIPLLNTFQPYVRVEVKASVR